MGGDIGYSVFRDEGTAPVSYQGIGLMPTIGVNFCYLQQWQVDAEVGTFIGIFENAVPPRWNFSTYDVYNQASIKYLQRVKTVCHPTNSWLIRYWLGGGLRNFATVTINTQYENAAVGVSEFLAPAAIARVEASAPHWILHGEASLLPLALVFRPGYSYIDNYTATNNVVDAQFSDYRWGCQPFAGAVTDIGAAYSFGNQFFIGLSYRWNVYSSGDSGAWKFVQASHLLAFDFTIRLTYNNGR